MKVELIHLLKEGDRLVDKNNNQLTVLEIDMDDEFFPLRIGETPNDLAPHYLTDDDTCWVSPPGEYSGVNLDEFEPTKATKDYMLWRLEEMQAEAQRMQALHDELYDILVEQPLQESIKKALGDEIHVVAKPNNFFQYSPPVKVGDCITIGDCQMNFHESKGEVLEISDDPKFKYMVMTQGVKLWVAESKEYCQCCNEDDRRVNCLYKM